MLVGRDGLVLLARDGDDLVHEPAGRDGRRGLLLAAQGPGVHLLPGDAGAAGDLFGGQPHAMPVTEHVSPSITPSVISALKSL